MDSSMVDGGVRPRVVTRHALATLLGKLPYDGLVDVADDIHSHARAMRRIDIVRMRRALDAWEARTDFVPGPHAKPASPCAFDAPVYEYTTYHGHDFYRARHCAGIALAVRLCFRGALAHVVWTRNRKAYIYLHCARLGRWTLHKVLHRQDDAFQTWYRHLGGSEIDHRARNHATPQDSFYHLVVPMFGAHRLLRSRISMRAVDPHDVMWDIVRRTSDALTGFERERLEWKSRWNDAAW